jgi:hypothetical protein
MMRIQGCDAYTAQRLTNGDLPRTERSISSPALVSLPIRHPAWNDVNFQKDRSAYMEAQAHKKLVCCRDTHAAYGRWFKEYLSAPCVPYWTLICLVLAGQQP